MFPKLNMLKEHVESPEYERVEKVEVKAEEDVEVEFIGVRKSTPPPSPINKTIHITDDREKTPEQQPKTVEDPTSTKKATTSQSSSHGFPRVPHDLGSGPIWLDDVGDLFNEGKINAMERKVSVLEKEKAKAEAELEAAKEKLSSVEAENVALKKEIEDHAEVINQLTEDIEEVNVQYKTIDNANKTLHEMLGDLHVSSENENEVLKKEIEALRADKVIKDEQLTMLYTVVEHKLRINVQVVLDGIEIQRVEVQRVEREKQLAEEAKEKRKGLVIDTEEIHGSSSQPDPTQADEVHTSNVEASNVTDVEMNEAEEVVDNTLVVVPIGEYRDDFEAIDNYNYDGDDDKDQGATVLIIVKCSGPSTLEDFLHDELNEQQEDQLHEASSFGAKHVGDEVFLTLPKVIYLHRVEEEGELDENRT
ncbi:hypothetical protein Hanom_Chr08g00748721 [Helianthus anomalus]